MQHFGKLKVKVTPKRIYMEEEFGFENTQSKTHICTHIYIYIYICNIYIYIYIIYITDIYMTRNTVYYYMYIYRQRETYILLL